MCIRDSAQGLRLRRRRRAPAQRPAARGGRPQGAGRQHPACLLYTSDAADERSSVDLGGRRIIKKKTQEIQLAVVSLAHIITTDATANH